MKELLDDIFGLLIFFAPIITPFGLVAFTPIGRLRQPLRFFVVGITSAAVAAFLAGLAMARGTMGIRGFLISIAISAVGSPLVSWLFSS